MPANRPHMRWMLTTVLSSICPEYVGAGTILGAVIGYNYISARGLLLEELRQKSNHLARATAGRIEVTGYAVEKVVQSAAFMLAQNRHDTPQQYDLLEKLVADNPEIFGAAIAP